MTFLPIQGTKILYSVGIFKLSFLLINLFLYILTFRQAIYEDNSQTCSQFIPLQSALLILHTAFAILMDLDLATKRLGFSNTELRNTSNFMLLVQVILWTMLSSTLTVSDTRIPWSSVGDSECHRTFIYRIMVSLKICGGGGRNRKCQNVQFCESWKFLVHATRLKYCKIFCMVIVCPFYFFLQ